MVLGSTTALRQSRGHTARACSAVVDFSAFLTTGFKDEQRNIILAIPEFKVPNGEKLL